MMKSVIFVDEAAQHVHEIIVYLNGNILIVPVFEHFKNWQFFDNLNKGVLALSLRVAQDFYNRFITAIAREGVSIDEAAEYNLSVLNKIICTAYLFPGDTVLINKVINDAYLDRITLKAENAYGELVYSMQYAAKKEKEELKDEKEEFEKNKKDCLEKIREMRELRLKLIKEREDDDKAKHEKELMEKAAKFEKDCNDNSAYLGFPMHRYNSDWGFLKYVDLCKSFIACLHNQSICTIKILLEVKDFRASLNINGSKIIKFLTSRIIENGDNLHYIREFCLIATTPEMRVELYMNKAIREYFDKLVENKEFESRYVRDMMFLLNFFINESNDDEDVGDWFLHYKNALIKDILGDD